MLVADGRAIEFTASADSSAPGRPSRCGFMQATITDQKMPLTMKTNLERLKTLPKNGDEQFMQ